MRWRKATYRCMGRCASAVLVRNMSSLVYWTLAEEQFVP